jgi:C1A family cysteine protease
MNKLVILLIALSCVHLQETPKDESFVLYQMYLQKYSKVYENPDLLQEKYNAFLENYNKLQELLKTKEDDSDLDEEDRLQLDITTLFDMSDEDYQKTYLNFNVSEEDIVEAESPSQDSFAAEYESDQTRHLQVLPIRFDWRDRGVVTSVKHQGSCGSCYAYAAVANVESLYAIKYGTLLNLSEQQIVNCDSTQFGCRGGHIGRVYNYIIRNGLGYESETPYVGRKQICTRHTPIARIQGRKFAGSTSEQYIQSFLMKYGPLAAAVNADLFKYYRGGVFRYSSSQCSVFKLNHAVVIVGYGVTSTGVKYYVIKNTWGPNWGENGYMRIGTSVCGINRYIVTGIIA